METFRLKRFAKMISDGNIQESHVENYIQNANGLWLKRLTTELIMQYVTYLEMGKDKSGRIALVEEEQITDIHNKIIAYMSDINDFFKTDEQVLKANRKWLVDSRDYLTNLMKTMTAYGEYAKLLEYILNRLESDGEDICMDDEKFIGQVIAYIFSVQENMVINSKVKEVYSQMPIRLTKSKFYNLIDISIDKIKGISEDSLDSYIKYLGESFSPEKVSGFGEIIISIYEPLVSIAEGLDNPTNQQLIRSKQSALTVVSEHINERISFYMTMSAIVNLLLGIQLISSEAVFKTQDAYVQQVLNVLVHVQARLEQTDVIDDMIDDLLYQLLSKLEGVIEDSEMTLGQYEGITEQLKLISQDMNEHVGEQIKNQAICYRLTSGSYYGALEENQASAPAGNRYMAMKKNELTSLMKDCFNEDSKWIQRARIAHLLTVANITQTNPKEIYEFMLGNFAPCKNQTEKSQSQKLIRILMSEV